MKKIEYDKRIAMIRIGESIISKFDKFLVKHGYYNRKYVNRLLFLRFNVCVSVTYPISIGKR